MTGGRSGGAFRATEGRLRLGRPLHLTPHRAASSTVAGAYPFLSPAPLPAERAVIGLDALTGERFAFDPWDLYEAGAVTNPNVLLAGVIGQGKSALAKSIAIRSIAHGRRVYVPADPKGEWGAVARAVGGTVIALAPGGPTRINPLEARDDDAAAAQAHRLRLLGALAQATLDRPLHPAEHSALESALRAAELAAAPGQVTIPDVVTALTDPNRDGDAVGWSTGVDRVIEGRDLVHALRRLLRGDLAGMFDGPSTVEIDPATPMLVLDLSALDDAALAVAMTCAAGWVEAGLTSPGRALTWVIYDEAWRVLRLEPLVRRMQAQWKLARAYGLANLLILHRLSDLDAAGDVGTHTRALAAGLLADCSTRVVYRQESDQIPAAVAALGMSQTEAEVVAALPRGAGLWSLPGVSYVVHHVLASDELPVIDTDQALHAASGEETSDAHP